MERNCVIEVDKIGKQYRIAARQKHYKTLRDLIGNVVTGPYRACEHHATPDESNSFSACRTSRSTSIAAT